MLPVQKAVNETPSNTWEETLRTVLDEIREIKKTMAFNGKALLTIPEAAHFLSLAPPTIRNGLGPRAKKPFPVPAKRLGRKVVFRRADLEEYVRRLA